MLRFRRDRLYIGLEPDRLTLVRLSSPVTGWATPQVVDCTTLAFDENATESARVHLLRQTLSAARWQKAQSHLILADRLVRFFVAERPPGARNVREVRRAAELRFEDIFGVTADDWAIQLDLPTFARHQLGCAIRTSFVAELVAACTEAQSPVSTMTPYAVSEFNRSQAIIGRRDGWFAVLGRHSLWVGLKRGCNWLSAHPYGLTEDDVAGEFCRVMAQESLRASSLASDSPKVWLSGWLGNLTTRSQLIASPAQGLGAPLAFGQSEAWCATYRLALSPVWPCA